MVVFNKECGKQKNLKFCPNNIRVCNIVQSNDYIYESMNLCFFQIMKHLFNLTNCKEVIIKEELFILGFVSYEKQIKLLTFSQQLKVHENKIKTIKTNYF